MEVTLAALVDGQRSTGLALSISVCTSRCLCLTDSNDFVSEVTFESVVVGFQKVLKKKKKDSKIPGPSNTKEWKRSNERVEKMDL